jgi:hypothetical protein
MRTIPPEGWCSCGRFKSHLAPACRMCFNSSIMQLSKHNKCLCGQKIRKHTKQCRVCYVASLPIGRRRGSATVAAQELLNYWKEIEHAA